MTFLKDAKVPFNHKASAPLDGLIEVTHVDHRESGAHVIGRGVTTEYRIRLGDPLVDEAGKPISGLEKWKLQFVDRNYALFSDGKQFSGFTMP